jgi:hypothetical protein
MHGFSFCPWLNQKDADASEVFKDDYVMQLFS